MELVSLKEEEIRTQTHGDDWREDTGSRHRLQAEGRKLPGQLDLGLVASRP